MTSKKVFRVAIRLFGLLGLAGMLAVSASAGAGTVPDPDGPGHIISQPPSR